MALTRRVGSNYNPTIVNERASDGGEVILRWRLHRLREDPSKIALVAGGYAAAFVFWRLLFPHPIALFLPLIALTSALAEYLFPIEYTLSTKGAQAKCGPFSRLYLAWSDVRRATHGRDGVYLSPLRIASRLDSFRGVRLHYGKGADSEHVRETVRRLWKGERPVDATPETSEPLEAREAPDDGGESVSEAAS